MKNLKIGDIINIPPEAVAPCLHPHLEGAEVIGFRESIINGPTVILRTREPWQAATNWPLNSTIGIPAASL